MTIKFVTEKCLNDAVEDLQNQIDELTPQNPEPPTPTPTTAKLQTGIYAVQAPIAPVESVVFALNTPMPGNLTPVSGQVIGLGSVSATVAGAHSFRVSVVVTAESPVEREMQGTEAVQLHLAVNGGEFYPIPNAAWVGPPYAGTAGKTLVHYSVGIIGVYLPLGASSITMKATASSTADKILATYKAIVGVELAYATMSEVAK